MNRTQWSNADDQRGLLKKEDLILPNFLQLPLEEPTEEEEDQEEQTSETVRSTENLTEPESNTEGNEEADSSTASLCSTEPGDRNLTKECSNPARETVV